MMCGACHHLGMPHAQLLLDSFSNRCEGCWQCERDRRAEQQEAAESAASAE